MSRMFYNIVLTLVIIAGAIRSFMRGMVETVCGWFGAERNIKSEAKK